MNRYVVTVLLFLCPATSLFAVAEEVPAPDWASYSEEVNLSATDWLDNSGNAFQLWTGTVQVVENGENQEYEVSVTWNPQALSAQITVGGQSVNSSTDYSNDARISFQTAAMPGVLGYIYVYEPTQSVVLGWTGDPVVTPSITLTGVIDISGSFSAVAPSTDICNCFGKGAATQNCTEEDCRWGVKCGADRACRPSAGTWPT
jgi:hypothetical protein